MVEERLARLGEQLLPLQDRASRMLIRHLKALAELRRGPAPAVAIGRAHQVNVGGVVAAQQATVAVPDPEGDRRAGQPGAGGGDG